MIKSQLVKASTIAGFAVVIVGAGIFWITHQSVSGDTNDASAAVVSEAPASGKPSSLAPTSGALAPQSGSTLAVEADSKTDLGTCSINTPCASPTPQVESSERTGVESVTPSAAPTTATPHASDSKLSSGSATGAAAENSALQFHDLLVKTTNELPTLQYLAKLTPDQKNLGSEALLNSEQMFQQITDRVHSDASLRVAGHQFFVECFGRSDLPYQIRTACQKHAQTLMSATSKN